MDEKIKGTIDKVVQLAHERPEFGAELRKQLNIDHANSVSGDVSTADNIKRIREILEIRGDVSITYAFVRDQRLKDQLIVDNLRMENAALNLALKDSERFFNFCINAFYQVEGIVNYYFAACYPNMDDFINCLESNLQNKSLKNPKYHPPKNLKKDGMNEDNYISMTDIIHKINAICEILSFSGFWTLDKLRSVRNMTEHRSASTASVTIGSNSYLESFLREKNFSNVRTVLKDLAGEIENRI